MAFSQATGPLTLRGGCDLGGWKPEFCTGVEDLGGRGVDAGTGTVLDSGRDTLLDCEGVTAATGGCAEGVPFVVGNSLTLV